MSAERDEPYQGQLRWMDYRGRNKAWKYADGSLLSINIHMSMFALLGARFGGDGRSNFAVPDLREMVPGGIWPGMSKKGPPPGTIVPYTNAEGFRAKIAIELLPSCVLPFESDAELVPCIAIRGNWPQYPDNWTPPP